MENVTKKDLDELTYKIIGAAIEVHKQIGPGLVERLYHKFLAQEFLLRSISFKSELRIPITYKVLE